MLLLACIQVRARVFFVGSNPHLTVFAFPQDILLVPGDFAYAYTSYQNLPWWGDIDEPEHKPSNTYLSTGEKIFTENGDSFEFKSAMHVIQNRLGFSRSLANGMKNRWDLQYSAAPLRCRAEGSQPGGGTNFTYKERNSIHNFYLQSILAMNRNGTPLGFKFGMGTVLTRKPHLSFDIANGGETQRSDRLIWGWTPGEGSSILNGGDARFHNEYAIGPLYRFDFQTAATIPRHKIGVRMRYVFGKLSQYAWSGDAGSSNGNLQNYNGAYLKSEWAKKIRTFTVRPYINYTWYERDKFKFSTLVLSRFTQADSTGVLSENLDVENGLVEKSRTIIFQCNPNISVTPWKHKMTYIDAAFLLNYSHMRYDFTRSGRGGGKKTYVNTTAYLGEDYSWQNFSYGRRNFVEGALDIHTVFPVYGGPDKRVAAGLSMLLWRRFKWFNKYYGRTTDNTFHQEGVRKNFDRETWLNSVINLFYGTGGYNFRLDIGQPLIYSLLPRTHVTKKGVDEPYSSKKESMWVSQGGIKIGLFAATSLTKLKEMGIPGRKR